MSWGHSSSRPTYHSKIIILNQAKARLTSQRRAHLCFSLSFFENENNRNNLKKQLVFRARANSLSPCARTFMGITFDFVNHGIVVTQRMRRSASLPFEYFWWHATNDTRHPSFFIFLSSLPPRFSVSLSAFQLLSWRLCRLSSSCSCCFQNPLVRMRWVNYADAFPSFFWKNTLPYPPQKMV